MLVSDLVGILRASAITVPDPKVEIATACGSDMMSDVLAFVKEQSVLLTGLVNTQVVRTAQMMDIRCIVFVRGKQPSQDIISLAEMLDISLLTTPLRMFTACGKLYEAGLRGGAENE
jgi:hypothetical protein